MPQPTGAAAGQINAGKKLSAFKAAAGCCIIAALAGCVRNTTIIAGYPPGAFVSDPVTCWVPADKTQGHLTAKPTAIALGTVPPMAMVQHVNGCAAVVFQLTCDGKAKDIRLLREHPLGYGFAAEVAKRVRASTYASPTSQEGWYYTAMSIVTVGGH